MFGIFKSKPLQDDFYEQHKLSPQQEPLLIIGSLLLENNETRDSLTLKSRLSSKSLIPLLNDAWGINDGPETRELLDELLQLPVLKKVAFVPAETLSNSKLFDLLHTNCKDAFARVNLFFSKTYFDSIRDVSAWDIERAGLVTRYAYNVGWLTEEVALSYLSNLYSLARQRYTNWLDYYIAYFKGRVLLYDQAVNNSFDYSMILKELYKREGYFNTIYPL